MTHVLAMGRYAAYVWPAYAVSVLGIFGALFFTLRAYRQAKSRLAALDSART